MLSEKLTAEMQNPAQTLRDDNEIPSFLLLKFLTNYHVKSTSLIKKLCVISVWLEETLAFHPQ